MNNQIFATWMISNNIGDALTPWLIEKITGSLPIYVPFDVQRPKYMLSGSILNHAIQYTTVWGAGLADNKDTVKPEVDIRAVRGPLSSRRVRVQAGIPVTVVGDPAWLLPKFVANHDRLSHKVGIIPHYVHQAEVAAWIGDRTDVKLINVFDTPEKFVDDLCTCEVVYSSSLHGLIIADAYGIPSQWIECTAPLGGDGMKFYDHLLVRDSLTKTETLDKLDKFILFSSEEPAPELNEPIVRLHLQQLPRDINALHDAITSKSMPTPEAVKAFCDKLWEACPFKPEENGDT